MDTIKAVCRDCPLVIRRGCLDFAIRNQEMGVWGGTSDGDREAMMLEARGQIERQYRRRNLDPKAHATEITEQAIAAVVLAIHPNPPAPAAEPTPAEQATPTHIPNAPTPLAEADAQAPIEASQPPQSAYPQFVISPPTLAQTGAVL